MLKSVFFLLMIFGTVLAFAVGSVAVFHYDVEFAKALIASGIAFLLPYGVAFGWVIFGGEF